MPGGAASERREHSGPGVVACGAARESAGSTPDPASCRAERQERAPSRRAGPAACSPRAARELVLGVRCVRLDWTRLADPPPLPRRCSPRIRAAAPLRAGPPHRGRQAPAPRSLPLPAGGGANMAPLPGCICRLAVSRVAATSREVYGFGSLTSPCVSLPPWPTPGRAVRPETRSPPRARAGPAPVGAGAPPYGTAGGGPAFVAGAGKGGRRSSLCSRPAGAPDGRAVGTWGWSGVQRAGGLPHARFPRDIATWPFGIFRPPFSSWERSPLRISEKLDVWPRARRPRPRPPPSPVLGASLVVEGVQEDEVWVRVRRAGQGPWRQPKESPGPRDNPHPVPPPSHGGCRPEPGASPPPRGMFTASARRERKIRVPATPKPFP